jgi:S-DNA-T family DNA segregation ATPase FtsK/SpoIIIE
LLRLIRDAAAVGLTVVLAGDRSTLSARLSSSMQHRLVLRLSDPNDYAMTGLSKRAIPDRMPPGRAVDCADGSEIQLAILGSDASAAGQLTAVARIVAETTSAGATDGAGPLRITALPEQISLEQLSTANVLDAHVILGAGGDEAAPVPLRLVGSSARLLIAGPPRSGRSTALNPIATQLRRHAEPITLAGGRRSGLADYARKHNLALISPEDIEPPEVPPAAIILIDDVEAFTDTAAGDQLTTTLRHETTGVSVVATGRNDELAVTFRGLAAELKKARTGLLLQPGPGDGDLLGVRLPFGRTRYPVGRGLLVADTLLEPGWPSPLPIQIARP